MAGESLEISAREASEKLREGRAVLIDVREPEEFALTHIADSKLMPMNTVPAQLQTLEGLADERDLLVLCHHGIRSLQVTAWLRDQGITNSYSVAGGIDRWSLDVDGNVPRY